MVYLTDVDFGADKSILLRVTFRLDVDRTLIIFLLLAYQTLVKKGVELNVVEEVQECWIECIELV